MKSSAQRSKEYRAKKKAERQSRQGGAQEQSNASNALNSVKSTIPTWLAPVLSDRELAGKVQETIRKHQECQDRVLPVLKECRAGWLSDGDLVEVLKLLKSESKGQPIVDHARRYNNSLKPR